MPAATQFATLFKEEHRAIRDALLNLIQAFRIRDLAAVRQFLDQAAVLSGPHFRYQEESLYPALLTVLDEEQVQKLLSDHDRAIDAARNLTRLAMKPELNEQDAQVGAKYARSLSLLKIRSEAIEPRGCGAPPRVRMRATGLRARTPSQENAIKV